VDSDTFNTIWPQFAEEMGTMMQFWYWAREKSWTGEDGILTKDDLNMKENFIGTEQAVAGMNL